MKDIVISLPEREIKDLLLNDDLGNDISADRSIAENASVSRAVHWMNKSDIAILTAWRSENDKAKNNQDNRELQESLYNLGYGITKVRGCYREIGQPTTRENSFLVFNNTSDRNSFLSNIFALSERYNQDCFLFKPAGSQETAYLIGTNDNFGKKRREIAGQLHIEPMSPENYTKVGGGRISFE